MKQINLKRLSGFLSVFMLLVLGSSVFAFAQDEYGCDEFTGICYDMRIDSLEGINLTDFDEATAEFIAIGNAILRQRSTMSAFLNVPMLRQNGQPWSNNNMNRCNRTIGNAGCLVTSFAMVNRFFGSNMTPAEVNAEMGTRACPWYWGEVWRVNSNITLQTLRSGTFRNPISTSTATPLIIGGINSGLPVIIGFENANGNTHFVVATGYNGSTIFINDPASNRNFTRMNQYLDAGWEVHRIAIYNGPNARPPQICDQWGNCIRPWMLTLDADYDYQNQ